MKKSITVLLIIALSIGLQLGYLLSRLFIPEKYVVVQIKDGIASYESNVNRDGDIYSIIIGNDTVSSGIIVNGTWEDKK